MGIVVGLDGCPTGWIAAVVRDGSLVAIEYRESALAALRANPEAEAYAFDIPIGLSPDGKRKADVEARGFLGERANSVFWAPLRAVVDVDAASYATFREAYAEGRRVSSGASGGRQSVSSQSFTLVPKIRDVGVVATDARVFEVHPEVSFAALSDGQPLPSKKTWDGLMRRRDLLRSSGLQISDSLGEVSCRGVADDVVDAVACAWTAFRISCGEARSLPDPLERITDCDVAIWY